MLQERIIQRMIQRIMLLKIALIMRECQKISILMIPPAPNDNNNLTVTVEFATVNVYDLFDYKLKENDITLSNNPME